MDAKDYPLYFLFVDSKPVRSTNSSGSIGPEVLPELPRILHIHVLPLKTGSGINTFLTMNGLRRKYRMELACAPGGMLEPMCRQSGIPFRPIRNFVSELRWWKDFHALWQLYRLIRSERYDLIHTHNSKGGFLGRLAGILAGRFPVVHTVHGFAFHENETALRRKLFLWMEKAAKKWAVHYICISEPLVDLCVGHGIAPKEKITKIYSGIEVSEFKKPVDREAVRKSLGVSPQEILFGQVSKLWEGKGHEDLVDAFAQVVKQVPNAQIVFVGEGPLRERLENRAREKGIEGRVKFIGHRDDIPSVTHAFDIAVLASHFEGMGRVVLEGMAAGKPVIATRVGGIVDLVEPEITGVLVEAHRPDQLAEAMVRLARNPQLCREMGLAGEKRVDERFSAETMISQIDKVYEKIIAHERYGKK